VVVAWECGVVSVLETSFHPDTEVAPRSSCVVDTGYCVCKFLEVEIAARL
jgi:hypothetical protein